MENRIITASQPFTPHYLPKNCLRSQSLTHHYMHHINPVVQSYKEQTTWILHVSGNFTFLNLNQSITKRK